MDELKKMLEKTDSAYIFGAGEVAERFFKLVNSVGRPDIIKGFLVSSSVNNPKELLGRVVYELHDSIIDSSATVFMTVSESYHPEAYKAVKERGFDNVVSVMKWHNEDIGLQGESVGEEDFSKHIDHTVDNTLTGEMMDVRHQMIKAFIKADHPFGNDIFYQSLPELGIKGFRPTDVRIREYQLDNYLTKDAKVLDIGCNLGFLDLCIADGVSQITGLEYSKSLVDIGNMAIGALKKQNVKLICADYNEWEKSNKEKYDMIFSFAVHIWLDISPDEYARQCKSRINDGGYLIFESQKLPGDKLFDVFVKEFDNVGLHCIKKGKIKDDGVTDRKFVVLEKTSR